MVSYNEHLKHILSQVLGSYESLQEIRDNPGDLDHIKKEMLRINGFLKVMLNSIDDEKIQSSDFKKLKSKFRHYLESYFFEKEIETLASLYSDDVHRVKNMRLKIIEALDERKMIEDIGDLVEKI